METKANYVAVGAFVLASVLGVVIALLWLVGFQYSQEYASYQTVFTGAVTGLGDGTIVRYNGIDVGRVKELKFDPNNPKSVIVEMQVNPKVRIPDDSFASIASEGITGGSYVEIDGGSAKAAKLGDDGNPNPMIKSRQSTLQQLEQSAPALIEKLNHVASDLEVILNPKNRKAIGNILANVDTFTGVLAKRGPELDKTLTNLATATDTMNVDLQDLHTVLGNANNTVTRFDKLAGDADDFVNGDGLAQISQLVGEARRMVNSLTALSNQLDAKPTSLIFGDRHKGYSPK